MQEQQRTFGADSSLRVLRAGALDRALRHAPAGSQPVPKSGELSSIMPPNAHNPKPEDVEELRSAYQAGRIEKHKAIQEFADRYGLTRRQVYKCAFNNGLTRVGPRGGTLALPEEAQQILREAAGRGRPAVHAAINRAMRFLLRYPREEYGQVVPAILWKHIRKYRPGITARRPYQRAHWSPEDLEILRQGYLEGPMGVRRCVRELMRRHPDWSRDQIHWKARSLGLHWQARAERNGRRPWSEKEDMTIISSATRKPITSIARNLGRSVWAVRCRLAGLRVRGRVSGQDYGSEEILRLLQIGRRRFQRLIGSKKLKCTALHVSRRSVEEFLRKENPGAGCESGQGASKARRGAAKKHYTFQKAAARLGMTPQQISELLAKGLLRPYRPRVSEPDLWQFLEKYGWELQPDSLEFESLDCEPQKWVKRVPELSPDQADSLAKLRAERRHTQTIKNCRYCGHQVRGNACASHERRCPQRPNPQPSSLNLPR